MKDWITNLSVIGGLGILALTSMELNLMPDYLALSLQMCLSGLYTVEAVF